MSKDWLAGRVSWSKNISASAEHTHDIAMSHTPPMTRLPVSPPITPVPSGKALEEAQVCWAPRRKTLSVIKSIESEKKIEQEIASNGVCDCVDVAHSW